MASVAEKSIKTAIFCFARMNPPHIGHGKLITSMFAIQRSIQDEDKNADIFIYLQGKSDDQNSKVKRKPSERKDPLKFEDKRRFVEQYIEYSLQDAGKDDTWFIKSEFSAQKAFDEIKAKEKGYTRFYFLMGADRRDAFSSPDFETKTYTPMYKHIANEGLNWAKNNGIPTHDSDFIIKQRKFYQTEERDGDRKHEIHLNNFEHDYLLSSYAGMIFPLIEDNTVLAVINPRVIHRYHLNIDGDKIERDPKSVSATEVRALINNYVFSFTKEQYDGAKLQDKVRFYADEHKKATFKDILDFLLRQGYFGKTSIDQQKALIMDMIVEIKYSLSGNLKESFGYIDSTAEARRSRRESMEKKSKGAKIPDDIKVLSYNVCWECSEPKKGWFNKDINYYEPDMRNTPTYKIEGDKAIMTSLGDQKKGLEYMCNKDVQRCRRNIGSIIENGKYDLVGMQEYIPHHDARWMYDEHYSLVTSTIFLPIFLPIGKIEKPVLIGSLFNKERFDLINHVGGEFLITKKDRNTKKVTENAKDGRPFLILHLIDKYTGQEILFINAHMPQTWSIPGKESEEKAKNIYQAINKKIDEIKEDVKDAKDLRIILATDSNDQHNFVHKDNFLKHIKILNMPMRYGSNYKKTCCTTVVEKILDKGRQERRIRYGDAILDSASENESFTYSYPAEIENEPYSDHAPIATELKIVENPKPFKWPEDQTWAEEMGKGYSEGNNPFTDTVFGGRIKKRTRRRKRKRTRRKKKRKRRRTKKKRKKRRKRNRTKRR